MGETAKILSPDKKVIIPDLNAGCSLADSAPTDKFKEFLTEFIFIAAFLIAIYPLSKTLIYTKNIRGELKEKNGVL